MPATKPVHNVGTVMPMASVPQFPSAMAVAKLSSSQGPCSENLAGLGQPPGSTDGQARPFLKDFTTLCKGFFRETFADMVLLKASPRTSHAHTFWDTFLDRTQHRVKGEPLPPNSRGRQC